MQTLNTVSETMADYSGVIIWFFLIGTLITLIFYFKSEFDSKNKLKQIDQQKEQTEKLEIGT